MGFQPQRGKLPQLLLIAVLLTAPILAQNLGQGNYTSLVDAFPQLAKLTLQPASAAHRKPTEGGQNFTHCCLLAVNQSLELVNGSVVSKVPSFIKATVDELLAATARGQFPCGAVWDGDRDGAPLVQVPSSWLESTCPGWQLSDTKKGDDSEFISPFVGFLLPAVVFCKSSFSKPGITTDYIRSDDPSTTEACSMAEIVRSRSLPPGVMDLSTLRDGRCGRFCRL
jgi:hypothetical protein